MTTEKIFIIGAAGHAKVIIDIVEKQKKYSIVGLIASKAEQGHIIMGYTVIGTEDDLPQLMLEHPNSKLLIAIGDNWTRYKVYERVKSLLNNVEYATAIHPSAQIGKGVTMGQGSVVMAGAILNSDSNIGDFSIINTKASIDHDNTIGNFTSVAPNVTCGGNVTIGDFTAISISATIKHGIHIGTHTVIGAGSIVLTDVADYIVAYGIPAKRIRTRVQGEKYL